MFTQTNRWDIIPSERKHFVQSGLLQWITEYLPKHSDESDAVKNKFSQVLGILFQAEYLGEVCSACVVLPDTAAVAQVL